jgi:hypothetical protein
MNPEPMELQSLETISTSGTLALGDLPRLRNGDRMPSAMLSIALPDGRIGLAKSIIARLNH